MVTRWEGLSEILLVVESPRVLSVGRRGVRGATLSRQLSAGSAGEDVEYWHEEKYEDHFVPYGCREGRTMGAF